MFQRIGITGASGVGKTTLCTELAKIMSFPVAREGAREAASSLNINSCSKLSIDNALKFQMKVLEWKIHLEDECGEFFISDRTVIDCAAYWIYRELQGLWHANYEIMMEYFNKIKIRLNTLGYETIVFLESGSIEWSDDGFRTYDNIPISTLILGLINGEFHNSLYNYGTKFLYCPKEINTITERIEFILNFLKSK